MRKHAVPMLGPGGTMLLYGQKFDLEKVLDAVETLLDPLCRTFAPHGDAFVTSNHSDYQEQFVWPDPARETMRWFWHKAAGYFEVVDEPLVLVTDHFKVRIFALGKAWCEYRFDRDAATMSNGSPADVVTAPPELHLFGKPDEATVRSVAAALQAVTAALGAELLLVTPVPDIPDDLGISALVGRVILPHDKFGDGHGPIRVRCIIQDDDSSKKS